MDYQKIINGITNDTVKRLAFIACRERMLTDQMIKDIGHVIKTGSGIEDIGIKYCDNVLDNVHRSPLGYIECWTGIKFSKFFVTAVRNIDYETVKNMIFNIDDEDVIIDKLNRLSFKTKKFTRTNFNGRSYMGIINDFVDGYTCEILFATFLLFPVAIWVYMKFFCV